VVWLACRVGSTRCGRDVTNCCEHQLRGDDRTAEVGSWLPVALACRLSLLPKMHPARMYRRSRTRLQCCLGTMVVAGGWKLLAGLSDAPPFFQSCPGNGQSEPIGFVLGAFSLLVVQTFGSVTTTTELTRVHSCCYLTFAPNPTPIATKSAAVSSPGPCGA
jgi:hypothetical protein